MTINTLSMIAEDYKESRSSSQKLYAVWRERLLRNTNTNHNTGSAINTTGAEQLVAIYVLDSILKNTSSNTNTNGRHHRPSYFVELVQADAATWMPTVYANVRHSAHQREKLHKVWRLWQDTSSAGTTGSLFEDAAWKSMGECFGSAPPPSLTAAAAATTTAAAAASSVATSTTLATSPPPVAGIARTVRNLNVYVYVPVLCAFL